MNKIIRGISSWLAYQKKLLAKRFAMAIIKHFGNEINPYALLATRLGLRMYKSSNVRHKYLSGEVYFLPGLTFINPETNERYVLQKFGFVHASRHRLQSDIRELKVDYELLKMKTESLEKGLNEKEIMIQELTSEVALLQANLDATAENLLTVRTEAIYCKGQLAEAKSDLRQERKSKKDSPVAIKINKILASKSSPEAKLIEIDDCLNRGFKKTR